MEAIVIPSWAPASISDTRCIAPRAILARALPVAASCSILVRRAAMRANSAATKNALAARSTTPATRPQLVTGGPRTSRCRPLRHRVVILVAQVAADDLLNHVVEGEEPGDAASFVDHDREVATL